MLQTILSEILNIINLIVPTASALPCNEHKWLRVSYGNRTGYLPYDTEEEKQKLLEFHRREFE